MSDSLHRVLIELPAGGTLALTSAVEAWHRIQREHGLRVLDDHEASLAPGLYAPTGGERLSTARVRTLARSWELFDRAFEIQPLEDEIAAFDERLWPFLIEAGLLVAGEDLAEELLFLFDDGRVASFLAANWDAHLARAASRTCWRGRQNWLPDELTAYLHADDDYPLLIEALRRVATAAVQ